MFVIPRNIEETCINAAAELEPVHEPQRDVKFKGVELPKQIFGKKVLLVDDSEINRIMLQHILLKGGIEVEMATNGEEALNRALKYDYDALLMDVQMPVMDGYEATRRLRQQGYSGPIIAVTAHAMKADRDRCLNSGYSDYLSKPIEFEKLFSTLARVMVTSPGVEPGSTV